MADSRQRLILHITIGLSALIGIIFSIALGIALAATLNNPIRTAGEYRVALPSQVLDRDGELITEFFSDEKREIISIDELPKHLIYALLAREDQDFFKHKGISIKGIIRAAWSIVSGGGFQGASTITQQVVGQLGYVDRTKITITRKLKEMWYALQLERVMTKNEILEIYLNSVYFGSGTNGVEAASQFYFGHSAHEISLAESVLLVIQLAAPGGRYSPLKNPNSAQKIQLEVLRQMIDLGFTSQEEADESFNAYWSGYDYTRPSTTSAIAEREDKAPWFSEYIRTQLEQMILGSIDIYRDGFVIHTTLDLDYQREAERLFSQGLAVTNKTYQALSDNRYTFADETIVPIVDALSLLFDIDEIRVAGTQERKNAKELYRTSLNPALDMLSMVFGVDELKYSANLSYAGQKEEAEKTTVEGALITLENETGYILAMVGGSKFERINQLNRALQAQVPPGSSFKPLYYSAAMDSGKFTPATAIWDGPVVFWNDDGTPYTPLNYKGEWIGWVRLREALAHSMNVPSIKVLDTIGFDAAIERTSTLLGMTTPAEIAMFPRKYPLGLGVISVAPIQMAKAFSVFANQGREVVPLGIRYIEDRNGRVVMEPEKDVRIQQRKKGDKAQLISPQTAYLMTDLLQTTVQTGTLEYARLEAGSFKGMPMAGKTGTTQNWSDAWTVGFSPYVTTAIWFGFDKPGNSLGVWQTGATATGPVWAKYMKAIHKDLPVKEFPRPAEGLREVTICTVSGLLPTEACDEGTLKELFIEGTEPKRFCDIHEFRNDLQEQTINKLQGSLLTETFTLEFDDEPLTAEVLNEEEPEQEEETDTEKEDAFSDSDFGDFFSDFDFHFEPELTVPEESSLDAPEEEVNPLLD